MLGRIIGGRYEVTELIGKGGFGAVFAARHALTGQDIVLKVMRPEVASDPVQVKRFMNEARITSQLSHPNTVRTFDFGQTDDGLLYLAMERLQGDELAKVLNREAPLDPLRVVRIGIGVLKSLAEAHTAGLVHRDLKPGNIFLLNVHGETDFVKLIDFGIAKSMEPGEEEDLTRTGLAIGTPKYMSPEQGRAEALDGRSDLYSLGIILYEALAGRVPFEASSAMSMIVAHLQTPPPDIRTFAPGGLPSGLAAIVMKSLSKDPWQRFRDADEMREKLEDVLEAAGGNRRTSRSATNHPAATSLAGPTAPSAPGQSAMQDQPETVALAGGTGALGETTPAGAGANRDHGHANARTADALTEMADAYDREAQAAQKTAEQSASRADASTVQPAPARHVNSAPTINAEAVPAASAGLAAAAGASAGATTAAGGSAPPLKAERGPKAPPGVRPNTPQRPAGPTMGAVKPRERTSTVAVIGLLLLATAIGAAIWWFYLAKPEQQVAVRAKVLSTKAAVETKANEPLLPPTNQRIDNRAVDAEKKRKASEKEAIIAEATAAGKAPELPVEPRTTEEIDKVAAASRKDMIGCAKTYGDAGIAYNRVGATLTVAPDGKVKEAHAIEDLVPEAMRACVESRMLKFRFSGGQPEEQTIKAFVGFNRQVVGSRAANGSKSSRKGSQGSAAKPADSLW